MYKRHRIRTKVTLRIIDVQGQFCPAATTDSHFVQRFDGSEVLTVLLLDIGNMLPRADN